MSTKKFERSEVVTVLSSARLGLLLAPYIINISDSISDVNHKMKKPRIFILGYFEIDLTFRLCQSSPPPSDHTPGRFLACPAIVESIEVMSLLVVIQIYL